MSNPFAPVLNQGQNGSADISAALAALSTLKSFTVAQLAALPAPIAAYANNLVFCSNGNAGQPCLAYCNGSAWVRIAFGAAVATS